MTNAFRYNSLTRAMLAAGLISSPTAFAAEEHWVQRVNMSGVVEVEYGSAEAFDGSKSSDIAVATVEVSMDAKINDKVNANITLLHEEDDTDFSVDGATIEASLGAVNVLVGQTVVPFGSFESTMLSDPMTLELAETPETILQIGAELGPLQAMVYMYNGDIQETGGDDVADQSGFRLAYVMEGDSLSMDIGIDYINNIADSDGISSHLKDETGYNSNEIKAYVPAQMVHANISIGSFHIMFEHLAVDKFESNEIAFNSKGAEITATNVEVAYDFNISGIETTVGLGMQTTEEAVALGMPKEKTLAAISFGIAKYTALTFEYANSTDYDVADDGTGKSANSFTAQLAVGF